MTDRAEVAAGLYRSLAEGNRGDILSRLHPTFSGHTTAGLPLGLGGVYGSPQTMLRDFWGQIARSWIAAAYPSEYLPLDDDRLLVRGVYRGRGKKSGTEFDAEFVHILRFDGDRIVELTQLTDSARWAHALEPETNGSETNMEDGR
ncbi:nuclear transport factor 2 family protein [Rhodococcus sp. NPDC060086]|uniref:nuclear transport factor 2 family protein n=1 Tax=Rhodococcus sp. NPDC060086 TaxID=3347055 RepID=UPI00365590DB